MSLSTLRIAWRNLGRNRRRTALAIGAIALGQFTLVFVNCMMAGSFEGMLRTITGPLVGHVQVHHPEWREERALDLYVDHLAAVREQLQSVPGIARVSPRTYAPALAASGEKRDEPADAEPAMLVGIDPDEESVEGGLLSGLSAKERPGHGGVALGKVLARRLGVRVGELLAVIGQDADGFPASDLFEIRAVIGSSVDIVKSMGVVMSLEDAGRFLAMPDQAHEILIHGDDYRRSGELAVAVSAVPILDGMEVISWREAVPELVRIIDMKGWIDLIFLAILFVAASAGIANTAMMSTFERTHEFGMLLAVGSRPGRIVRMVLIESVILGLIGVLVGSLIGTGAVLLTGYTGIDYAALAGNSVEDMAYAGMNISYVIYPKFEWRHVIFGLFAVTFTSALASTWPAMLAARLEPVEAMRS